MPSSSGDISGIFCRARIPLHDTINVYNGPAWFANTQRPDLVHQALWAVAEPGDAVSDAISRTKPCNYALVDEIQVRNTPPLHIYRRIDPKAER